MMHYVLYGLLNLSFWGYVVAALILTQITIAAVTIFLHRHQAHRALDLHPIISHFFRFWLWAATGIRTKEWVAIHRKHHAKCETADDPHSPQIYGIRTVMWEGYELYRRESTNEATLRDYSHGVPNDWLETRIYDKHPAIGILIMLGVDLLLFGIPGLIIWSLQMIWIPFFAAGVVNGIGHFWGYRNFECYDAARNIIPWGIFIGGEELHNNHHTYGTSAKMSVKWWEFDIGWLYIRCLSALKLAKVKKLPPQLELQEHKLHIDADALKAILISRFQVMAHYTREVVIPVLRTERAKAGATGKALFKRAKLLLTRTDGLISQLDRAHLTEVLRTNSHLQQIYQAKQKLQDIWSRTTASQKELIEALQEWCQHAEATGIEALHRFAAKLKTYTLKQPAI